MFCDAMASRVVTRSTLAGGPSLCFLTDTSSCHCYDGYVSCGRSVFESGAVRKRIYETLLGGSIRARSFVTACNFSSTQRAVCSGGDP